MACYISYVRQYSLWFGVRIIARCNKLFPLDLVSEISLSLKIIAFAPGQRHMEVQAALVLVAAAEVLGDTSPTSTGGTLDHYHEICSQRLQARRECLIISMPVLPSGNQWSSRDRKRLNQKKTLAGPILCPPIRSLATNSSVEDTTRPWAPPPTVGMPRPCAIGREVIYQL